MFCVIFVSKRSDIGKLKIAIYHGCIVSSRYIAFFWKYFISLWNDILKWNEIFLNKYHTKYHTKRSIKLYLDTSFISLLLHNVFFLHFACQFFAFCASGYNNQKEVITKWMTYVVYHIRIGISSTTSYLPQNIVEKCSTKQRDWR